MLMKKLSSCFYSLFAVAGMLMLITTSGYAAGLTDGVEVGRDASTLRNYIGIQPVDPEHVNTVLVFTNAGRHLARVACVAFDQGGNVLDRAWLPVPANGMRFALASDITGGRDFVGNVKCVSGGRMIGSAVLVGPGLTALPVKHAHPGGDTHIRFPVVAAY